MKISSDIINLFCKQGFAVVSTLTTHGTIHNSVKGIVGMEEEGTVLLIDLYRAQTFHNLKKNPTISITAVDEHQFVGYALSGKAAIVEREEIKEHIVKQWEERVIQRISKRVIQNIQKDKRAAHHPEAKFPHPQYLIEMTVKEIIDLTPTHLRKQKA